MTTLNRNASTVKPTPAPAESWPSTMEVDGWFWTPSTDIGPDPVDQAWAAEALNADFDDEAPELDPAADFDPAELEDRAVEAEHQARFPGLISQATAEAIEATGLVGHREDVALDYRAALADLLIHQADRPEHCPCWPCIERRTRHLSRVPHPW